jgi:glycosidase
LDDVRALVDAAHQRGMRVLLDFVPSHLSNQHPLFQDAYKNPASPYSDWFVWTNEAHSAYAGFANNETMPRFNHYNPEVVAYLSEAARFWLDLDGDGDLTDGVDGFRVDNATFPPREFLVTLRQAVKTANPQALMLGETWVHTPSDLANFFPDQFDALFDFPFYALMQGDPNSNGDGLLAGKSHPALLTTLIAEEERSYPPGAYAVRFLSNHDTNRIASEVNGAQRQRLAAQFTAALPGPLMLYYGEEIGMLGQKGGPPHWDNYRREPMDWYAGQTGDGQAFWFRPEDRRNQPGDGVSVEEQLADPASTLNATIQAFSLRRTLPAGKLVPLALQASGAGVWGFLRSDGEAHAAFLFNFSAEPRQVAVEAFPFDAPALSDLLSGASYPAVSAGQPLTLTLPAASSLWLAAAH